MIRTALLRRLLMLAPVTGLLWLGSTATAAPANDDLASATDVNALLGGAQDGKVDFGVNPEGATLEPGEDLTGYDLVTTGPFQGSLWYRVANPQGGKIRFEFRSTMYFLGSGGVIPETILWGFVPQFDIYRLASGQPATLPLPSVVESLQCPFYISSIPGTAFARLDHSINAAVGDEFIIRMQVPSLDRSAYFSVYVDPTYPDRRPPDLSVEVTTPSIGLDAIDATEFKFAGRAIDYKHDFFEVVSGIARVEYRLAGSSTISTATYSQDLPATGETEFGHWSASVSPAPGPHVFQVRGIDRAGNVGVWLSIAFVRAVPPGPPLPAAVRDMQSFGVDDAPGTGWIGGTYYVDQGTLEYGGVDFGSRNHGFALNSRGWPINIVYDLAAGRVTALLSLPGR